MPSRTKLAVTASSFSNRGMPPLVARLVRMALFMSQSGVWLFQRRPTVGEESWSRDTRCRNR